VSIVLILGPVHMQDLRKVMDIAVRGALTRDDMKKGTKVKEKNQAGSQ
jgi:hypothetical protein